MTAEANVSRDREHIRVPMSASPLTKWQISHVYLKLSLYSKLGGFGINIWNIRNKRLRLNISVYRMLKFSTFGKSVCHFLNQVRIIWIVGLNRGCSMTVLCRGYKNTNSVHLKKSLQIRKKKGKKLHLPHEMAIICHIKWPKLVVGRWTDFKRMPLKDICSFIISRVYTFLFLLPFCLINGLLLGFSICVTQRA